MNIYSIIVFVCIALSAILALYAIIVSRKQKTDKLQLQSKRNTVFFINLYEKLKGIRFLKNFLINIRRRLEIYNQSGRRHSESAQ